MHAFKDLLAAYTRHMNEERDLSPKTVAAYLYDIGTFEAWAGAPAIPAITPEMLSGFLASLGESRRPRSLASMAGLLKFAVREGVIPSSPAAVSSEGALNHVSTWEGSAISIREIASGTR